MKHKRVLITGASGFIGANLLRRCLREDSTVHVFTRKTSDKWRIRDVLDEVLEHEVDLCDEAAVQEIVSRIKPEIIFHTASFGGFSHQSRNDEIFKTNFFGTVHLLDACLRQDFELFVNAGSSSEYGVKMSPMKESDFPAPFDVYGITKTAATVYAQRAARQTGRPVVTLRLFSPYGYYEAASRLVPAAILSCLDNRDFEAADPTSVRDFIFIEDVIDAFMMATASPERCGGEVINIGFGRQRSVGDVVAQIIESSHSKVKPVWKSRPHHRPEPGFWQGDISKAAHLLGWSPRYDLKAGLVKSLEWFKENHSLYESKMPL